MLQEQSLYYIFLNSKQTQTNQQNYSMNVNFELKVPTLFLIENKCQWKQASCPTLPSQSNLCSGKCPSFSPCAVFVPRPRLFHSPTDLSDEPKYPFVPPVIFQRCSFEVKVDIFTAFLIQFTDFSHLFITFKYVFPFILYV